jgi:hypothetical protein
MIYPYVNTESALRADVNLRYKRPGVSGQNGVGEVTRGMGSRIRLRQVTQSPQPQQGDVRVRGGTQVATNAGAQALRAPPASTLMGDWSQTIQ